MLILWPRLLRMQYRRWRARSTARAWIAELDAIKADWGASGELWEVIGQWMAADPLNNQEFLMLFRTHHRRDYAAPTSRYVADRQRSVLVKLGSPNKWPIFDRQGRNLSAK